MSTVTQLRPPTPPADTEVCPLEHCRHPHDPDERCLYVVEDRDGESPCGCWPCERCKGYGVIVVGQWRGEDTERVCPRCDGWGQR